MASALTSLVIGVIAIASANAILVLLAFLIACITLAAVTIHFLSNVAGLDVPTLTQLGWVDVGLSACATFGAATDLGINWQKLVKAV